MVSLNIFMAPPPWATWWAYTIYILLVLGAIWGFISWRTREQRKKLREVEKLNTRLRQVDRLKDQFLANTSHELRTPLHGIIGLSESMIDGVTGKLAEKTVEMLKLITFSGKRLSFLVNDILDFSKLKSHEKLN
jgi:signal transduction histidine kinase